MRLIDADALIENWQEDAEHMETEIFKLATYAAINDVKHAPTVAPERKNVIFHGDGDSVRGYDSAECPSCGYVYDGSEEYLFANNRKVWGEPFCPHCGQKLEWEWELLT